MKLTDMFPFIELENAVQSGFVSRRAHPTLPLCILAYTDKATYTPDSWNAVTRACRGLIYDTATHEIVARPFPKFFNFGTPDAPQVDLSSRVIVTDKIDGSLGILYDTSEGLAISTRGCFDSEQAIHSTEVLRTRYTDFVPPYGITMLFEIVYPDNRIVVDYGALDDLVLLGAIDIETGTGMPPNDLYLTGWPGPRAQVFEHATLADALSATPRPNAEGLVVFFPEHNERVKIKQADYVALHRIVTGLNERTVWEHLSTGKPLAELLEPIPEEFHDWVHRVADELYARIWNDEVAIERAFNEVLAELPKQFTRKDFAMRARATEFAPGLFAKLDNKDYTPTLWRNCKPEARRTPTGIVRSESVS